MMYQVMQEYAAAMLPKAIRTNCKYYGVNELGSENLHST